MSRKMIKLLLMILPFVTFTSCVHSTNSKSLLEARNGFTTKITNQHKMEYPVDIPPKGILNITIYSSPVGELSAYISPDPKDGEKHPAIIWLVGGFDNSISDTFWTEFPSDNDQSASAFREAGIVMMYPSLRGGNENPGSTECLYGEVADVLAAAEFLAKQEYVDADRIYLGGHSTGGTLSLLVAESSDLFRATFSFGPIDKINNYGSENINFDETNQLEYDLRSPILWMDSVKTPVYVFEGVFGNMYPLAMLKSTSKNDNIQFFEISDADHFNILSPVTKILAKKIIQDKGDSVNITIDKDELNQLFE